jgi:hypothetical protein
MDNGCRLVCPWTMPAEPGMLAAIHPLIPQTPRHSLAVSVIVNEPQQVNKCQNLTMPTWCRIGSSATWGSCITHSGARSGLSIIAEFESPCSSITAARGALIRLVLGLIRIELNFYMRYGIHCIGIILVQGGIVLGFSLSLVRSSC